MRNLFLFLGISLLTVGQAAAQNYDWFSSFRDFFPQVESYLTTVKGNPSADSFQDPPVAEKSLRDAALHPIPQDTVAAYLEQIGQIHVFDGFQTQTGRLKSLEEAGKATFLMALGYPVEVAPVDMFGAGFQDGPYTVHETAVVSADALALRLIVDLSRLAEDEEAWVIDTTAPRAFGPYTSADHTEGGRWLPTVEGDTAVLMTRSLSGAAPDVGLVAVSHFYRAFDDVLKVLDCNINIACETNPAILDVASGIGILVVPQGLYDAGLCTGTLLNNPDTPALEPYFLTSWHCVPDGAGVGQVDVVWDYRAASCGSNAPPSLASLPRSLNGTVLATNASLDETLIELDAVPSGAFGRTYLGWNTQALSVSDNVITMHFPRGTHMRISYGALQVINQFANGFANENQVLWSNGVTEKGSSGCPLLLTSAGYQVVGTLSTGPTHVCPGSGPGTYNPPLCPAQKVFQEHPELIANLRVFRDNGLATAVIGKQIIQAYYKAAPSMADAVEHSPDARHAFIAITAPFAGTKRLSD